MNQTIRSLSSLDNFKKAGIAGQMATFLILVITVMLIFVLTLVNVGQVSNNATTLANAADSASLYLASQLGTEAYQLSNALYNSCKNGKQCCKSLGFWDILKVIIITVVATIVSGGNPAASVAAAMWAIGTAIALSAAIGAIDGTGFLQGAIQGAIIGAALVGGAYVGGQMFGNTVTAPAPVFDSAAAGFQAMEGGWLGIIEGATGAIPTAGIEGVGAGAVAGPTGAQIAVTGAESLKPIIFIPGQSISGSLLTSSNVALVGGSVTIPSFAGAMAGVGLSASLSAANAYIQMEMQADAMAAAAKALNGLPKKKRIRESVFLRAFGETVDDPNKVEDTTDIDGDGDIEEKVPVFQVLWDKRTQEIKTESDALTKQAKKAIDYFFETPAVNFQNAMNTFKSELARMEIEGNDGAVTGLLRALEDAGYPISFWMPGPSAAELQAMKDWKAPEDCETCEPPDPPPTYDELDSTIDYLQTVSEEINTLKEAITPDNWDTFESFIYDNGADSADQDPNDEDPDPEDQGDGLNEAGSSLYDAVGSLLDASPPLSSSQIGLRAWNREIETIRDIRIPDCLYDPVTLSFTNPPCQGDPNNPANPDFATTDPDLDDEFIPVIEALNQFILAAEQFRRDCKNFYDEMSGLLPPEPDDEDDDPSPPPVAPGYGLSGENPATYRWQDSRGDHTITVQTNKFKMPKIKKKSSFFKTCLKLKRYKKKVKVKITREDPSDVAVGRGGLLGRWNPSGGRIERVSVAKYRAVKYKTLAKEAEKNYVKVVRRTWD